MARKEQEGPGFDPLGWMFTFSDLVTLLLTFFVMLISMKQPEIQKLKAAFSIFEAGSAASLSISDRGRVDEVQRLLVTLRQPTAQELTSEEQKLARKLDLPGSNEPSLPLHTQRNLKLRRDKRGVVITLANDLLFKEGSAQLGPKAQKAIKEVAEILLATEFPVSVEGHTDNLPLKRGVMGNWQLSLDRALAVLHELRRDGVRAQRLSVAALADTRPLVPNDTPEHRAMNRRTEIVLLTNQ